MTQSPSEPLSPRSGRRQFLTLAGTATAATVLACCAPKALLTRTEQGEEVTSEETRLCPVYLTIVSHNEEPGYVHPDYIENPDFYFENRKFVRKLALAIKGKGAMWNFGSDWNYLMAVAKYDVGDVTSSTSGKNIVRWLVEDMGFEADPHAHETKYNYADVAYLHTVLGVQPSSTVGGFLSEPPDNPQGWEQHIEGIHGQRYPDYFWKADLLWGGAVLRHAGPEHQSTYGMWKPKDKYHFMEHDPAQRLPHIGSGCQALSIGGTGSLYGTWKILDAISRRAVPLDGFYTTNPFVPQGFLNDEMIRRISDELDALDPYVQQGQVIWSSLSRTARIWEREYRARPFMLACVDVP